uniref:Fatty acid desaturase domain-containing protein n=1 Tax=Alexandrium catenella TaxID=2925 RepID=A0A7S1LSC8_ALECA|mmetsp:Transcript_12846/g.35267  ORF Transcript_12846/g.35267 Transcript_12846/m.35267 type:complete len:383 (-) Transcript_12846:58-1206(-)
MSPPPKDGSSRVQVLSEIDNADLKAARNEYHFRTPFLVTALSPLLKDKRDEPMLCLMLNIVQVIGTGAPLVYSLNIFYPDLSLAVRNLVGLAYMLTVVLLFQERFTLMLHFSSHRVIFHNDILNGMLNWVFAPFFGVPCGVYKLHHVIMHHIENNHELDMSSTETFQRDSLIDLFKYWVHFALLIWVELPYYCFKTQRYEWAANLAIGLCLWAAPVALLARYVNFTATMWVFVVPHIFSMSVMAFGNWSQHIFVNPQKHESNYGLTYNCMDTPGNQTTFNDGYHIVHHLNARLHWSEVPDYFYQTKEKHLEGGALTFRGLHFFDVGILVFTGRLRKLAQHYVHLGDAKDAPTVEAVEEKLREWLKPVPPEVLKAAQEAKKAK